MPPYLCALYSLDPKRNPEAFEVVSGVFVEEMLHLALAANILNAIGGQPQISVLEEENGQASALWVTGRIPVLRADGGPLETRNRMTLCRCGHSADKPLCDGTHRTIGFHDEGDRAY